MSIPGSAASLATKRGRRDFRGQYIELRGTKYKKGDRLVLPPEGMDICAAYEGLTPMSRLACFLEADRLTREEIGVIKESLQDRQANREVPNDSRLSRKRETAR